MMPDEMEATAVPQKLCRYCENVAGKLRATLKPMTVDLETSGPSSLKGTSLFSRATPSTSLENDLRVEHFPNIQAFINSILQQRCHLCAILAGRLVDITKKNTVEEALETLDNCQDKANRPLLTVMTSSTKHLRSPRRSIPTFELLLGYDIDGRTLDTIASVELRHGEFGKFKKDVAPELLSTFTGSDESYANIRKWLHICATEHVHCRSNSKRRIPKRLLDLESRNKRDVRLVAGSTIGQASYAALSYCWGSVPQLVLSHENYSDFETRIPLESLSKVAQDATTVCRALSVRYLWIDAMCIIQGPGGDFEQEAARMEDVYTHALFTVTAAASADTTNPFLVRRYPLSWIDCELKVNDGGNRQSYFRGNSSCIVGDNLPGTFALDSRGWCFQEQFLSPRSIYFGAKGVHWECRESITCERFQDMKLEHIAIRGDGLSRKTLYKRLVSLSGDAGTTLELRRLWGDILERYSTTQLTHRSDRLIALAGVASMFESKFNIRASFGLWLEMFLDEILWTHHNFQERRAVRLDIAPSWSWASLQNCVISCADTIHTGETDDYELVDSVSATIVKLPKVTGFTSLLWDPSAGNEALVRLRGRLVACVHRIEKSEFGDDLINQLHPEDRPPESTPEVRTYYPDTDCEETVIYCFLVRREYRKVLCYDIGKPGDCEILDQCLVLAPVLGSKHRFRRIGVYHESININKRNACMTSAELLALRSHMFAGEWEEQEIEIV